MSIRRKIFGLLMCVATLCHAQDVIPFTAVERQQISVPTPGLFGKSTTFNINLDLLGKDDYSFPLPVGKAKVINDQALEIVSAEGDVVKAMFDGVVRLSRKTALYGNTIVVRHNNGLETVYGNNSQNLVKVGQSVKAGQNIAVIGGTPDKYACLFAILINGRWVNPRILIDPIGHKLHRTVYQCHLTPSGNIDITQLNPEKPTATSLFPDDAVKDAFAKDGTFRLNLDKLNSEHWAYPLPGSHVISPFGGKRHHSGVDIKTKPNDNIVAAFDGVVTRSGVYFGYGNCIVIKHAYGLETLYGHQSKNFVQVGQKVKAGEVIGLTGRTGRATTEHLHFEVRYNGRLVNPALFFDHANRRLQRGTVLLGKGGKVSLLKR